MQGWFQFCAVVGAASATLLGLLFVAVSINAAATMVLLSSATVVSWELLLRMAKTQRLFRGGSS